MKKIYSVMAISAAAAMLVAGCGKNDVATVSESATEDAVSSDTSAPKEEAQPATDTTSSAYVKEDEYQELLSIDSDGYFDYAGEDNDKLVLMSTYDIFNIQHSDDRIKEIFEDINKDIKEQADSFEKENAEAAKEMINDEVYDENGGYYTFEQEAYCERLDAKVVSAFVSKYIYTMGAHGGSYIQPYNYDAQTGEEITVDKVFKDTSALPEEIKTLLLEKYDPELFFDADSLTKDIKDIIEDPDYGGLNFTLGVEGITVRFGEYALAPYASGTQEVLIPWTASYVDDTYAPDNTDEYILPVYSGRTINVDDSDFSDGSLTVSWYVDQENMCTDFSYYPGQDYEHGKNFTYDEAYDADVYYVHAKDGDKLWINVSGDNDYERMQVFDINDDYDFEMKYPEYSDEEFTKDDFVFGLYSSIPLSNKPFEMFTRTDLMGTINVCDAFKATDTGDFERMGEWLYAPDAYPRELTLKQDVSLPVLTDENTGATTEKSFSKGDKFTYYRTDGISIVDIRSTDGEIIRLQLEKDKETGVYNQINGQFNEDLFDGIMYAG